MSYEPRSTRNAVRSPPRSPVKLSPTHSTTTGKEQARGTRSAQMDYSPDGYANNVVIACELAFRGWPLRIPFLEPASIPGGVRALETLRAAWEKRTLTLERATPEDVACARCDPESVHPNQEMLKKLRQEQQAQVVACAVHHPESLDIIGEHLTSTRPSGVHGPRRQRADVKKVRNRSAIHGCRRPRHPRDGVKSSRCILDGDTESEGIWLVDDPLGELRPVGTSRIASYSSSY
ncbi:hypothetical protein BN946_scf184491.g7 [Trametes cinnabarina]|uniref:Uncharacterized protein n=1 Tax=Pycnoporus cinnabarinus TaxID=5643 RepID=A0A060SUQ3_PYCCI|nr:hypothetical protein BN946_scf184491.g7 [Trametes cinnabarina]